MAQLDQAVVLIMGDVVEGDVNGHVKSFLKGAMNDDRDAVSGSACKL